jgi:hypothetical protein
VFDQGACADGGDLVAIEVDEGNGGLLCEIRGEDGNASIIDQIVFEIEFGERDVRGESFGDILCSLGGDFVAAQIQRLEAQLLENFTNMFGGNVVDLRVDERQGFRLIVSGQSLGKSDGGLFCNVSVIEVELGDGIAVEQADEAGVDASSGGGFDGSEVIEVGNLGSKKEVSGVALFLGGGTHE